MKLYRFKNGKGSVAVTPEQSGSSLPVADGPWSPTSPKGTVEVNTNDGPRIGKSSQDILDEIEKDGFSIWPVKIAEPNGGLTQTALCTLIWLPKEQRVQLEDFQSYSPEKSIDQDVSLEQAVGLAMDRGAHDRRPGRGPWIKVGDLILGPDQISDLHQSWYLGREDE